jgi:hypothetical protein
MEFFFDKFKNNICIRSLARRNTYPLAKLGKCNFEATSQNGEIRKKENVSHTVDEANVFALQFTVY